MPNRVIKESLLSSEKISALTDFEFRLWVALILLVDDAGRGDARPAIIKGRAFPLRERVSTKDIENAIHGLAAKGCVSLYTVDGKPYFWFPTWGNHQRIRDAKPKYPDPVDFDSSPRVAASCGELRPKSNPIQYESESEYKECIADKPPRTRFAIPSVEDVKAYCSERGNDVDPQRFVDYYTANGWKVGKNPMKDWKATVRTWERGTEGGRNSTDNGKRTRGLDVIEL